MFKCKTITHVGWIVKTKDGVFLPFTLGRIRTGAINRYINAMGPSSDRTYNWRYARRMGCRLVKVFAHG